MERVEHTHEVVAQEHASDAEVAVSPRRIERVDHRVELGGER